MTTPNSSQPSLLSASVTPTALRMHAEQQFSAELDALTHEDRRLGRWCPPNWKLSPTAVRHYLLGGPLGAGNRTISDVVISPKYIGKASVVEMAIAALLTDRALLLYGSPGTAKSWLSEHLAAAVCGDSTLIIQGSAGIDENALRYGWNYARLLVDGPSEAALVPTPMMEAMREGKIVRVEELTRIPTEAMDTLLTPLSEKALPVPELRTEVQARQGFNLIATANDRDKGVNELSSALKRRFTYVVLPLPETLEEEVSIVKQRAASLSKALQLPTEQPALDQIRRVVTVFRELRKGETIDGRRKVKSPSETLSTAEAISVIIGGMSHAACFGSGRPLVKDFASGIVGAVVKDPVQDRLVLLDYMETVVKARPDWLDLRDACLEVL